MSVISRISDEFLDIFAKDVVMISEYCWRYTNIVKDSPRVCNTQFALSFMGLSQGCQLSRIIRESQDFEPYLPVSRFMLVISRF